MTPNRPRPVPQAAILDLDGTLVDTLDDFCAALGGMLHDLGHPAVPRQVVERLVGRGSEHLIREVLAHVGADAQAYDAAWVAYQRHYLAVNGNHARVYPGVEVALQRMRAAGLRLGCLTNKPGRFATALLEAKGLAGYFEVVFGGDAFERKKPDPLPLRRTCEALGVAGRATWMIGDSRNDAQAARAAGCPVLLVSYGYNHGQPVREVDADGYLDSLADLPADPRDWPGVG